MNEILAALKKIVPLEKIDVEIPPDPQLGDYAFPCFPLSKLLKKNPQDIAQELSKKIELPSSVERVEAKGPYLNFFLKKTDLARNVIESIRKGNYGKDIQGKTVMVEFPSPNTNKPLHLGHLRNIFLGMEVCNILRFLGNNVIVSNLINDRGIHICKSMLAYKKWGMNKEPDKKSDHFVGDFYVLYSSKEDNILKEEAQQMLLKWEQKDKETRALWKKMNRWALTGFSQTFKKVGYTSDKTYYESMLYKKGKEIIKDGKAKGVFYKTEKGAIAISLQGLGEKIVLREDGTSVYITQDIYLAYKKFSDFNLNQSIHVVGSEQEFHFKALIATLKKLEFNHASDVYHLSYGMVFLPEGKMKSREGIVVDADNIIEEITSLALEEVKKRYPTLSDKEQRKRGEKIGLAALRFFLLKSDAKNSIHYDPKESLSFEGETGPYIQYTYARLSSILRKYGKTIPTDINFSLLSSEEDKKILRILSDFPSIIKEAGEQFKIHLIARFLLELAQACNEYYHKYPILKEEEQLRDARIILFYCAQSVLKIGLSLMNIDAIEKM